MTFLFVPLLMPFSSLVTSGLKRYTIADCSENYFCLVASWFWDVTVTANCGWGCSRLSADFMYYCFSLQKFSCVSGLCGHFCAWIALLQQSWGSAKQITWLGWRNWYQNLSQGFCCRRSFGAGTCAPGAWSLLFLMQMRFRRDIEWSHNCEIST